MPMKRIYEYSQSADRFEKEPAGVCQALSARWIVARARWQAGGGSAPWSDASWMGAKTDMAAHVDRIYAATRAARTAVASEERALMEQEIARFNREKATLSKQQKRKATNLSTMLADDDAGPANPPGYSDDDLQRRLGGIRIPTLPRMLAAVMRDIADHGGLDGAVHVHGNVEAGHAAHRVCSHGAGYNLIDVRDRALASEGGAHAIAAEIRIDEVRLFDPNHGEWLSVPPGNAWSSFGALLNFLLQQAYELSSVTTLSVVHFRLKS